MAKIFQIAKISKIAEMSKKKKFLHFFKNSF